MKKAIIIGASSNNYAVGLVARREELLLDLQKELKTNLGSQDFCVFRPPPESAKLAVFRNNDSMISIT